MNTFKLTLCTDVSNFFKEEVYSFISEKKMREAMNDHTEEYLLKKYAWHFLDSWCFEHLLFLGHSKFPFYVLCPFFKIGSFTFRF